MVVGQIAYERDVIVIGGGPGGYTAAIRLAQLGKEVTLIEANQMGGICLNQGCIPSKFYSYGAAKLFEQKSLAGLGFKYQDFSFSFTDFSSQKNRVIKQLRKGVESLCKSHGVEVIKGKASFLSNDRIGVENSDEFTMYTFRQAVIATGARPVFPPRKNLGNVQILNDYQLYELKKLPEHLVIFGNHYLALEAAFSFRTLGSSVTFIEKEGNPDFGLDAGVALEIRRLMKKQKIKYYSDLELVHAESSDEKISSYWESAKGEEHIFTLSHLYIQPEYEPNLLELGSERAGIQLDEKGWIQINRQCETNVPGIYAVGDVTGGDLLAVKAIKQGKTAAETISGQKTEWETYFMPKVLHTIPPIASAGLTEAEAIQSGYEVKTGQFPLAANGYAGLAGKKDGFMKVIAEKDSDVILGMHIIGEGAIELISTAVTALEMGARTEDLGFPFYPHPSINEGLLEAVEDLDNKAIHQPAKPGRTTKKQLV